MPRHELSLHSLTDRERNIVQFVLNQVAKGELILHDWEFEIVMGCSPPEIAEVAARWPEPQSEDADKVISAFNNTLGYPHAGQENWDSVIPYSREALLLVMAKLRGQ